MFEEPPSASFTERNEAIRAWLVAQPKPLAVFCANDYQARRVVLEAIAAEISIPMQVAVLGVDDDELESIFSPVPLSSVVLDFARVGYLAAEVLTRLMAGKAAPKKPLLVLPLRVAQRRSSDVLAIGDPIVAEVVRYMWDHLDENLRIDDILASFPTISRRHFERRFRTALGRSPFNEIMRARIEKAKTLLMQTSQLTPWIATQCGFGNYKVLATAIKRKTGMSPSDYRKQMKR